MKLFKISIALIAAISLAACAQGMGTMQKTGGSTGVKRTKLADLKFRQIDTTIPTTKRVTLKNGMMVHLMPDRELPLFNVLVMIRAGSIWEPVGKEGLATLTGGTMRSGGTKSMTPDELDETLEFIAGSVETSIGLESGSASLNVLSKDTDQGLKLLSEVLRNPRFDEGRFEVAKARMLDGIRRENDDPTEAAMRELNKLIYAGSPYGTVDTKESVSSITLNDVKAFHKKYFNPTTIMLGITGDFDEATIIEKLEKVFGDWKGTYPEYPKIDPVTENFEGGIYIAEKKLPQSVIRAGTLAGTRLDPDYYTVRVMDNILGGSGFTSRLVQKVRTDKGLAYSVWSYTFAGRWELGRFISGAETKASSTAEVIGLIKAEMERMRTDGVSDQEVKNAKESIVNRFVFIFDKPAKILEQRMIINYYGMPDDYLEAFRAKIMAVTANDILATARKRLKPDKLKVVVFGDSTLIGDSLSEFGEIRRIELNDQ